MTKSEQAVATFKGGYNCAQAAFSAFASELGMSREQAMKVASGFGGGMARQGDTCGAVTGAMMALGLAQGSTEADELAKQRVYARIWELLAEFRAQHGSTVCRDLLGCDLGTEEGRKQAHASGVTKIRCPGFVSSAVEIVEKGLAQQR
jgi:C_GCAxxG_C_C family probable redox protein